MERMACSFNHSQRIMKIIPLLPPAAEAEKGSIVASKHNVI